MKAITKYLAAAGAIAAIAAASPAAAQYYPGVPDGYGAPGVIGGYGYNPYTEGVNRQVVVNQCANAVQARLNGGYATYGYGSYGSPGGRVLGISRVEPHAGGGLTVRGVAASGAYQGFGYAPNSPDLVWKCRTDFRGFVVDIDVNRAQPSYGERYTPWNYDYSPYGYQRY